MSVVRAVVLMAVVLAGCARAGRPSVDAELQRVWALYLEPVRASQESEFATARLRELLSGGGRFILVDTPDQAQAIVRVIVGFERPHASEGEPALAGELNPRGLHRGYQPPTGSIALVDADMPDRIIWTRGYTASRSRHRRTNPPPQTTVSTVIASLEGDLRRAAGRRMQ